MLADLIRHLIRKKAPIIFNDLTVNRPISSSFGFDRGTPIDRYYIEKFLAAKADLIRGRVLEVGDDTYSRRFDAGSAESFEVLHATSTDSASTIVGDLTDPATLPEDAIDCFICTQTFNFIFDVGKAVRGAHALLKPGGVLLATVAGISQISRYDMARWGDYWRFTTASTRKLFEPVFTGGVEVETFGNVLAATAFLQGVAVEDLPDPALLDVTDADYQLIIVIVARKA
jgi:SAM-dependent methyltransferase